MAASRKGDMPAVNADAVRHPVSEGAAVIVAVAFLEG